MSSTHHSLYSHIVFGTKNRVASIDPTWQTRLHAYLGGCLKTLDVLPVEIGGIADHVHILMGLSPDHQLSAVMRDIKRKSSRWIHTDLGAYQFGWQDGYGAFSVSFSNLDSVRKYIRDQEKHHRVRSFRDEYIRFLKRHMIEYEDKFV
jgi:REP element-mobilizing transposase RayT